MEPFDDRGDFWLPDDPSHTVSGRLTFDGESISLTIDGSLRRVESAADGEMKHRAPEWVVEPVVLGRLRNTGGVTLTGVTVTDGGVRSGGGMPSAWCNSPLAAIWVMMSLPPISSPSMYSCGIVGHSL